MKGAEIIKSLIISILVVICVLLVLSVIFYEDISLSKVIPQSEEYNMPEEMKQELQDTTLEETEQIVTKYYIDAADLKKYEKTKEYNKGKKNPFAVESVSNDNGTTDTNNDTSSNDSNKNESSNFYEDDGTK